MKNAFVLFLLTVSILMGCSKTDESIINVEETCRVSKISSGEIEWTFEYDGTGKVIRAKEKWTGSHEYSFNFSYFNDRIEVKITGAEDGNVDLIYKLNESGKITSSTKKIRNEVEAIYSYSPDGYMVKEISDFGVFTTSFTYNEGNLIHRKTEYSSSSYDIDESTYDYNASEGNFAFSSLVVDLYGEAFMDELHKHVLLEQGFFGKKPRMLPYRSSQNTLSYEKDSKGKILLVKDRSALYEGGELFSTIHYNCK